jgi:hypothetical protein
MGVNPTVDLCGLPDFLADRPVRTERMDRHRAWQIISRQQPVSARIHADVNRTGPDHDGGPKRVERAGVRVDPERREMMFAARTAHWNEVAGCDIQNKLRRISPNILHQRWQRHAIPAREPSVAEIRMPASQIRSNGIVEHSAGAGAGAPDA